MTFGVAPRAREQAALWRLLGLCLAIILGSFIIFALNATTSFQADAQTNWPSAPSGSACSVDLFANPGGSGYLYTLDGTAQSTFQFIDPDPFNDSTNSITLPANTHFVGTQHSWGDGWVASYSGPGTFNLPTATLSRVSLYCSPPGWNGAANPCSVSIAGSQTATFTGGATVAFTDAFAWANDSLVSATISGGAHVIFYEDIAGTTVTSVHTGDGVVSLDGTESSMAVFCFGYEITFTPTATPVTTATSLPTATPTPTATSTPTPTSTSTSTPTATPTPTPTSTSTPTATPIPTATSTPTPTSTSTATPVPTATPTSTPVPTSTPTSTATATPTTTPTATPTPTATFLPTITPAPTATSTPPPSPTTTSVPTLAPTATPAPTLTPTLVPTATSTATPVPTATLIPTATSTPTPIPTVTPAPTHVPTATSTPTPIPTVIPTATSTPTAAPAATLIPTATSTPTPIPTVIPTATLVPTATSTATLIPTATVTPTATREPSATPTATFAPTATGTASPSPTSVPTSPPSPTVVPRPTPAPSPTPIPTPIPTATPPATPVPTAPPAPTATSQPTPTATLTPTLVPTATPTSTATPVPLLSAPPTALPFVDTEPRIEPDQIHLLGPGEHVIELPGGPGRIIAVSEPPVGSAQVVDGQLMVTVPDADADTYTLSVTVERSGTTSVETVVVTPLGRLVALDLDDAASSISEAEVPAVTTSSGTPAPTVAPSGLERLTPNVEAPPALLAFQQLELPVARLGLTALASGLALLFGSRYLRRRTYLAIDRTDRDSIAAAALDEGRFELRHNARGIWATGRVRGQTVEIETPNGVAWVAKEYLVRELD